MDWDAVEKAGGLRELKPDEVKDRLLEPEACEVGVLVVCNCHVAIESKEEGCNGIQDRRTIVAEAKHRVLVALR